MFIRARTITSGGRGVILIDLEEKEKLISVKAISQKGVKVSGTGRAAKPQEINLSATSLAIHIGKRARKGKTLESKIKPSAIDRL